MSDPKTRKYPLRRASVKRPPSNARNAQTPKKAVIKSTLPNKSTLPKAAEKSSKSPTETKHVSNIEKNKAAYSDRRSRSLMNRKSSGDESRITKEAASHSSIFPQTNATISNTDSFREVKTHNLSPSLGFVPDVVPNSLPSDEEISTCEELSISKAGTQPSLVLVKQSIASVDRPNANISPAYGSCSVYTCNGKAASQNRGETLPSRKIINNLSESIRKQEVLLKYQRQIERGRQLLRVIELGLDDFREVFNLQPMDKHSGYLLRLCQTDLCHVRVQTTDDYLSRKVQTEEPFPPPYHSWTQIPPAYEGGHSGRVRYAKATLRSPDGYYGDSSEGRYDRSASCIQSTKFPTKYEEMSSSSLRRLRVTFERVLRTLEEDFEGCPLSADQRTSKSHSSFIPAHHQQSLAQLECIYCEFTDCRLLTVHQLKSPKCSKGLLDPRPGDMVCVWRVNTHSGQGSLESTLTCPGLLEVSVQATDNVDYGSGEGILCVLSESGLESNLVVGGLSDGSLVIWDLASTTSPLLRSVERAQMKSVLPKIFDYARTPDYMSSYAFTEDEKCADEKTVPTSPVIALTSLNGNSRLSSCFQFCSLDVRGNVTIWMTMQLQKGRGYDPNGSRVDLGLRPGCCVRLIQLAKFTSEGQNKPMIFNQRLVPEANIRLAPFTTCLEASQTTDRFFIGSVDGNIKQRCRMANQRVYPEDLKLSSTAASVTSLALHPSLHYVLIAGYADGHLALFLTYHPQSVCKWRVNSHSRWPVVGIRKVIWSPHRPSLAFCLSSGGDVIAWSLLNEDQTCLKPSAQVLISDTAGEREVVDFAVAKSRNGCLAICWQDGAEIHWLEKRLIVSQKDELLTMENVLTKHI